MKLRLFVLLIALLALTGCETATESAVVETPEPPPTTAPSPTSEAVQPTATAVEPTAVPAESTPSTESLIMLIDPLDEPEFYCIDVAGFGNNLNLNAPLQAHTCKPGAADELFTFNRPGPGQFFMDAYDVCLEAGDGALYVKACSDSQNQRFVLTEEGSLRLQNAEQCVAVQSGEGQPAGGRSHVRRDLLVQNCADVEQDLSRWSLPGPRPPS